MKILFDHPSPFFLAHGGFQTQIEQTRLAVQANGVEVEWVRWWDDSQRGDLIHYFGRPSPGYIHLAHQKGLKVVMAELLTGLGSRSNSSRLLQKTFITLAERLLPGDFTARLGWECYRTADACIANTPWEAQLMQEMFNAPPPNVHVVANGVEEVFLKSAECPREDYLVCTATITERKRVVELAEAAVAAQTPVWIVGRPYAEADPYHQRFLALVQQQPRLIRYEGAISDRKRLAQIYRAARGFVLLSTMETLSLSSFEAAACRCPLLLSDLPWARCTFGTQASYCPAPAPTAATAAALRQFHDKAPQLPPPPMPKSWPEIGREFIAVYERALRAPSNSR